MSNVTLLNDGGWYFLDRVTFPVDVEGVIDKSVVNVTSAELNRIGAKFNWDVSDDCVWSFYIGSECEVLS